MIFGLFDRVFRNNSKRSCRTRRRDRTELQHLLQGDERPAIYADRVKAPHTMNTSNGPTVPLLPRAVQFTSVR